MQELRDHRPDEFIRDPAFAGESLVVRSVARPQPMKVKPVVMPARPANSMRNRVSVQSPGASSRIPRAEAGSQRWTSAYRSWLPPVECHGTVQANGRRVPVQLPKVGRRNVSAPAVMLGSRAVFPNPSSAPVHALMILPRSKGTASVNSYRLLYNTCPVTAGSGRPLRSGPGRVPAYAWDLAVARPPPLSTMAAFDDGP